MKKENIKDELINLISSGRYVAKQQIGEDFPIEDYEGCEHNFFNAIAGGADLEKVVDSKSKYYQGKDTYLISYFGITLILSAAD